MGIVQALMAQMNTFDKSKPETYKSCTCRSYTAHVKALLAQIGPDATEEVAQLAYDTGAFFSTVTSAFADARDMFERALAIRQRTRSVADVFFPVFGMGFNSLLPYFVVLVMGILMQYGVWFWVCCIGVCYLLWILLKSQGDNADLRGVANCYNCLGNICMSVGDFRGALVQHERALAMRTRALTAFWWLTMLINCAMEAVCGQDCLEGASRDVLQRSI